MDRTGARRRSDELSLGRSRMMPAASWWHELSGTEKFRLYTQLTLQGVIAVVVVITITPTIGSTWMTTGICLAGAAAILSIQSQPELAVWSPKALQRWGRPVGALTLASVWLACALVAHRATDDTELDAATGVAIFAASLATIALVTFIRYRWWIVLGLAAATGAAVGTTPAAALRVAAIVLLAGLFIVATTLLTLWGVRVVDELERSKASEAKLQVVEERLRFARDLHDVVGRSFSAIAVKSELAATLSRAGAAERAATEIDEVKTLAVESLDQMRELVRGYRSINLDNEVAGARSLLRAAGCELSTEGDPNKVPAPFHEVAAWVVREGTTNIVKHSVATSATLTLGDEGMSLHNNGAPGSLRNGTTHSGMLGLAERLTHVGATLDTDTADDGFMLIIRWAKP
ncbi:MULTISPECIES: histidine kinase [unclassified Rhodococcus (in: high G+C Gram-positive bacteria)]|uniref:sensor histidine kinase n=1 Tax=unclassified Rhodococcus (in: high G+C Gram-positive bacteria) TaxID=192944 RepID=UPI003396D88F